MSDSIAEAIKNEGSLDALFNSTTCGDLMRASDPASNKLASRPTHPICLDSELSVTEGCEALAANKITSAPIYDAAKGGFVGMLDYRDLVAFVLSVLHKVAKEDAPPPADATLEVTDIVKRALSNKGDVPIKLISNLSHLNPLVSVQASSSVKEAVEDFVHKRAHRLIVLEPDAEASQFAGILSQSTIAALVASRVGKLAGVSNPREKCIWPTGNKTLEEVGLVGKEVVSVTPEDTVLDALHTMQEHHLSSVAIVERADDGNDLVGSISMTDIKMILSARNGWRRLYEVS
ncbi:cell separation during budding [Geranomyces michiganensis]|nr:cell separation during budding [Geranomyces michiganensis]